MYDEFQNLLLKLDYEDEKHTKIRFKVRLNQEIVSRMSINEFARMDDILEVAIDVEQDIKTEKAIKPREGDQVSSIWNQGAEFKKSFEKNAPRYPKRRR